MTSRRALVLAAAIVVCSSRSASAEDAPAAVTLADALTGDAKAAYEAGRILFTDGDFGGASLKMQRAYDLSKEPRLLWNIAACEKKLRHYSRVIPLVDRYLVDAAALLTPTQIADAKEVSSAMRAYVARLTMNVDQPQATISVDDAIVGTSPMREPFLVDQGTRVIRVTKAGSRTWSERREIVGGTDLVMDVRLVKETHDGRLVVMAGTRDQISVDGAPRGIGQISETLASGPHSLGVTADGMRPHSDEITIQDDATRTIRITLEPERSGGGKTWLWLTVGGAALVAAGVITTLVVVNGSEETTAAPREGTMRPGIIELAFPPWGR